MATFVSRKRKKIEKNEKRYLGSFENVLPLSLKSDLRFFWSQWHFNTCTIRFFDKYHCCGASEPEASERSSSLIGAVGSQKVNF